MLKFELVIFGDEEFKDKAISILNLIGVNSSMVAYRKDKLLWKYDCKATFKILSGVNKLDEMTIPRFSIRMKEKGQVVIRNME